MPKPARPRYIVESVVHAAKGFDFPEKYGEGLIRLALDILGGKPTPPALFVKHHTVTRENVDQIYPNDALMAG